MVLQLKLTHTSSKAINQSTDPASILVNQIFTALTKPCVAGDALTFATDQGDGLITMEQHSYKVRSILQRSGTVLVKVYFKKMRLYKFGTTSIDKTTNSIKIYLNEEFQEFLADPTIDLPPGIPLVSSTTTTLLCLPDKIAAIKVLLSITLLHELRHYLQWFIYHVDAPKANHSIKSIRGGSGDHSEFLLEERLIGGIFEVVWRVGKTGEMSAIEGLNVKYEYTRVPITLINSFTNNEKYALVPAPEIDISSATFNTTRCVEGIRASNHSPSLEETEQLQLDGDTDLEGEIPIIFHKVESVGDLNDLTISDGFEERVGVVFGRGICEKEYI